MPVDNSITMEEQARIIGLKLAFLIDSLNLPLEQKEAFFDALDFFNLQELEKLAHLLETIYLNEKTKETDNAFAKAIQQIVSQDQKDSQQLWQKTMGDLENIASELKDINNAGK